jgi:hypothetical protein
MRDELTVAAIVLTVLMIVGGLVWLLIRAGRRSTAKSRADLIAKPLASFDIDAATMRGFYQWQAADLETRNAAMWRRVFWIGVWIAGILIVAFAALGAWRTSLGAGALIGVVFTGIIMVPVILCCAVIGFTLVLGARQLRDEPPLPARAHVGTQGIAFEPGKFQPLQGSPFAAHLLPGPPQVLDLVTRYSNGKNTQYVHARCPIPAKRQVDAQVLLAEIRKLWGL